jgi:hypothetical protein
MSEIKKTTSNLLILVDLLNVTFAREADVNRDANVTFNPPDIRDSATARNGAIFP